MKISEMPAPSSSSGAKHSVVVDFQYGSDDLSPVFALEDQLIAAIKAAGAGEFDGNEFGIDGSDGSIFSGSFFMFGPDADRLFEAIRPVLESSLLMRGAIAIKCYGPPEDGVRQIRVTVGS